MSDAEQPTLPSQRHAFSHAPAALRIFRFAADSAQRVLEIAHVSAFLRECAVEFGSADAALPDAMRREYASGRYLKMRGCVMRRARCCPWLAEKLLACRSGAPMPAEALAPDVTRHDVNWGAEGARRNDDLHVTLGGFGLSPRGSGSYFWAQGPVGATRGKHWFQVSIITGDIMVGFADDKLADRADATMWFVRNRPGALGCLLDLAATPARMTIFFDGEPLPRPLEYDFPKDGRAWYPTVALTVRGSALHSCAT
jgi:hypothetical protein